MPAPDTLLILPAGYGDALERRRAAPGRVIGASSVADDPAAAAYDAFHPLPHVSRPEFDEALAALIAAEGVTAVHASHHAVWSRLQLLLPRIAPGVTLTAGRSNLDLERDYAALLGRCAAAPDLPFAPGARAPLTPVARAALLRAALGVPGESYEAKLLAVMEAARRAPVGDLVEIGSLFGRSAVLLALLARRYDLGQVLCVDPWSAGEIDQGAPVLLAASQGYDWAAWRTIFEINVLPHAAGVLNYRQATSAAAAAEYRPGWTLDTEAFGRTTYAGRIGLLHIDGNHDRARVEEDVRLWTPHLLPGAVVVFDDYRWSWGDGPRLVADAFVAVATPAPQAVFEAGGALFVQMAATDG